MFDEEDNETKTIKVAGCDEKDNEIKIACVLGFDEKTIMETVEKSIANEKDPSIIYGKIKNFCALK